MPRSCRNQHPIVFVETHVLTMKRSFTQFNRSTPEHLQSCEARHKGCNTKYICLPLAPPVHTHLSTLN